jgi:hypothetical protein
MWSEKTTVCRIFNCKRALKPVAGVLLPVTSSLERRLRGELLSNFIGSLRSRGADVPPRSFAGTFYSTPSGLSTASR